MAKTVHLAPTRGFTIVLLLILSRPTFGELKLKVLTRKRQSVFPVGIGVKFVPVSNSI
ncbi:hypothetical protein CANTEDRAFT_113500 [Yamadazyma tenuis ATCC 10573]|uniref:Uncharacterized protein n=1 Tax=Candida tenuis (strain ATCC 10573 / BCRC 21748 / CBS 615 / JCM 9827 / NBRC 10315 / NRRL Y-1498 / VKM Y-70) TaxID=590646 RepID=G3B2M7_CANTC|nr:uncharacterized protein CANTEDRAFT_113500 [Yamadazyma tenuis ATCC 10573]EGV64719.1 hypothetical protein CANTEDRAFT_113500 [Yamadazyma tenuis ATCC 10573]